jgi:hypothetical protein
MQEALTNQRDIEGGAVRPAVSAATGYNDFDTPGTLPAFEARARYRRAA